MKYACFVESGKYCGCVEAADEAEALKKAQAVADKVVQVSPLEIGAKKEKKAKKEK